MAGYNSGPNVAIWVADLVEWGEQRPLPSAHASIAPPETPRRLAVDNIVIYGESPGKAAGWSGAGLNE